MRFSASLIAALALIVPGVVGAPTTPLHNIKAFNGPKNNGMFIVKLKDNVSKSSHFAKMAGSFNTSEVTHTWDASLLNGFAGMCMRLYLRRCGI